MGKRYYWLKLPDSWFHQKSIKKLRRIAGGDTYTIIYLKMLLVAIKQDSKLYFEGIEDNFYEELALEIDEDPENVRIALAYLQSQHLVELREADEFFLPEAKKLTGSESESAERVRRYRDRKALQCNTDVTQCNDGVTEVKRLCNVEIEKRKEIEIDNNIYCPEASSGPDKNTDNPPAGPGMKEDAPTADSAKVVGAGAVGVKGVDAGKTKKLSYADADRAPLAGAAFGDSGSSGLFLYLILNTKALYPVYVSDVERYRSIYPAVDVEQELRNMFAWCNENRRNRKTKSGILKFINGWLSREQNKAKREGGSVSGYRPAGKSNQFNQFEHNQYNFDALEQELTGLPVDHGGIQ